MNFRSSLSTSPLRWTRRSLRRTISPTKCLMICVVLLQISIQLMWTDATVSQWCIQRLRKRSAYLLAFMTFKSATGQRGAIVWLNNNLAHPPELTAQKHPCTIAAESGSLLKTWPTSSTFYVTLIQTIKKNCMLPSGFTTLITVVVLSALQPCTILLILLNPLTSLKGTRAKASAARRCLRLSWAGATASTSLHHSPCPTTCYTLRPPTNYEPPIFLGRTEESCHPA